MLKKKDSQPPIFLYFGHFGCPDSNVLLDNLRQKRYKFVVAHVNYHKRKESDQDEKLVKEYCQTWDLPFFVCSVDPEEYSSVKNFQTWAREKRYNFFQKMSQQSQTKYIITAHHLDDHLETYLLQKQRKSLVEYWGLSSKIHWKSIYILRPLIHLDKMQIYQYLNQNKISYILDKTNYLPIYQRNIIRQKIKSFFVEEKEKLLKEIDQKNQELGQTKLFLKSQVKKIIVDSTLSLDAWEVNSFELKMRLIYYWINKHTNQEFVNRKKNIFLETKKQLESPKKTWRLFLIKIIELKKVIP